jgi:hypothetical protein
MSVVFSGNMQAVIWRPVPMGRVPMFAAVLEALSAPRNARRYVGRHRAPATTLELSAEAAIDLGLVSASPHPVLPGPDRQPPRY